MAGRLITWADAEPWAGPGGRLSAHPLLHVADRRLAMRGDRFAAGEPGRPVLYLRYRVENTDQRGRVGEVFAAILPFQVTPTWQNWRSLAGQARSGESPSSGGAVRINGEKAVIPLTAATGFGASAFRRERWWRSSRADCGRVDVNAVGFAWAPSTSTSSSAPTPAAEVALAVPSAPCSERWTGAPLATERSGCGEELGAVQDAVRFRLQPGPAVPPSRPAAATSSWTRTARRCSPVRGATLAPGSGTG